MTNLTTIINSIKDLATEIHELRLEVQELQSQIVYEKITINGTKNHYERTVYESGEFKNDKTRDWALKDLLAENLEYLNAVSKVENLQNKIIVLENFIDEKKIELENQRLTFKKAEIDASKVGI